MTSTLFYVSSYGGGDPLGTADGAAAGAGGTLVLDAAVSLTASKILAAPRVVGGGGVITVPSPYTLTVQGAVEGTGVMFAPSGGTVIIEGALSGTGQLFDVSSGGVVNLTNSSVDVTWFGAIGDGTLGGATGSDNTVAFNAAIACAQSLPQGNEVHVPPGVYDFTSTSATVHAYSFAVLANASVNKGFTLRGAGAYASIMQSRLTGSTDVMLGIGNTNKTYGVALVDMGFASNAVAGAGGTATEYLLVQLESCIDSNVERCAFLGGNNVQLRVLRPQGVHILDSVFHGFDNNAPTGMPPATYCAQTGILFSPEFNATSYVGGQATRVANCTIRDFRHALTHTGTGIHFEVLPDGMGHPKGPGSEFAVVDCDIENNDICVNENIGNNRFVRNSMESGNLQIHGSAAANAGTATLTVTGTPAQFGAYRMVGDATGANFTVYDPTNRIIGTAVPGTAFTGEIDFTISTGAAGGDTFIVENPLPGTGSGSLFVANPLNTGTGVPEVDYVHGSLAPVNVTMGGYTDTVGVNGVFVIVATSATMFNVYDPTGTLLTVAGAVTLPYTLPATATATGSWSFKMYSGTPAAGDVFIIVALGDTLFLVGSEYLVESTLYAQNTLEMDGVQNTKFFDLVAYSYLQMNENLFQNENGSHVYCAPSNTSLMSGMRNNTGLNMRTGVYRYPGFVDGTWVIADNIERSATSQTDTAPHGSTAPVVANLETLLLENTSATTITDFVNGHNGQELTVLVNESPLHSTLQNGSNIVLTSGANELLFNNVAYDFRATLDPTSSTPVWRQFGPAPRAVLQSQTANYISAGVAAGAATPPAQLQYAIDDLVIALNAAGLWNTLDGLWLFAVNDLKLAGINLIAPGTYNMTWPYATLPTFAPYFGVNGDGFNIYGKFGTPPNNLQRNGTAPVTKNQSTTTSFSVWSPSTASETSWAIGAHTANIDHLGVRLGSFQARTRLNDSTTLQTGTGTTNLKCLVTATRSVGGSAIYVNGASLATDAIAATSSTTEDLLLMLDGATYSSLPIAMAAIGAGRAAPDEANFYAATLAFMKRVGVVPVV